MTQPEYDARFDKVDLQALTTLERAAYLADLRLRKLQTLDPYMERAYTLRICEVERWQAICNRRETERQDEQADGVPVTCAPGSLTDRLREALCFALREVVDHNAEYKHVTPPEQIAAWRALIAEACAAAKKETDHG
jgi:hypothetical protein